MNSVDANKLITGGNSTVALELSNGDRKIEPLFNSVVVTTTHAFGSTSFISGETVTYPTTVAYAGTGALARGSQSFLRGYTSLALKNKKPGKFNMTVTEEDLEGNKHVVLCKGCVITSPLNVIQSAVGTGSLSENINFTIDAIEEIKQF